MRHSRAACSAVRATLKDVLPDGYRVERVQDDRVAPRAFSGNEESGRVVTVDIFVTEHMIREAL